MSNRISFDPERVAQLHERALAATAIAKTALTDLMAVDEEISSFLDEAGMDADEGDYYHPPEGLGELLSIYETIPASADMRDQFFKVLE